MHQSRRPAGPSSILASVATLLAMVLLASCGGGTASGPSTTVGSVPGSGVGGRADLTVEDEAPPKDGGHLVFGLAAETDGWNPTRNRWSASAYIVGFSIFDPLAAYDEDVVPRPYLAKAITSDASFMTWTIELRSGITFHDGAPLDAAAVAKNLEGHRASGLTAETLSFIDSVTVADASHVVVKMKKPWAGFPNTLTSQVGAIASPAQLDAGDEGTRKPVGTGPFRFEDWQSGKHLKVSKNASYWRKGYPHLDSIEFRVVMDNATRAAGLAAHDIDITETGDPSQIADFTEQARQSPPKLQLYTDQQTDGPKIFLTLNHAQPPFDDPLAREAVAAAVDRKTLSEVGFGGVFPPATGPFSETSPFYVADAQPPAFDLARAKAAADRYAQAHGSPLKFTFAAPTTTEAGLIAQVLQKQFADAGIEVTITSEEQVTLIVDIVAGRYEAGIFSLFASPSLDTDYAFLAGAPKPPGQLSLNFARVSEADNATLTAAFDASRATADPAELRTQYAIIVREMAKNLGFVFLVRQTTAVAYDPSVHGAKLYDLPGPDGQPAGKALIRTAPFTFAMWIDV